MGPIKLLFSGDFAPIIPVEKISANHFSELNEIFETVDLHVTNLECPLTNSKKPIEKTGPSIKADPGTIGLLQQAKVNIACLANNHLYDYGEEGINDTITVCGEKNIETIGIVSRQDREDHWLIKDIKGIKIGFLNYCEHEFSVRGKGLLGACGYDPVKAYYDINNLKPRVNYLIIIYHGGNEYYPLPRPALKKDFHFLADLGADAVIGHHTHVFSGYEIYKGKPLVYSLGNFFFPFKGESDDWHKGLLCSIELDKNSKITLFPVLQCQSDYMVQPFNESDAGSIHDKIERLSGTIRNDMDLKDNWNDFVKTNGKGLADAILFSSRVERFLMRLPGFPNLVEQSKRKRMISNIIRCQSLSELITDYYKIRK